MGKRELLGTCKHNLSISTILKRYVFSITEPAFFKEASSEQGNGSPETAMRGIAGHVTISMDTLQRLLE